MKAVQKARKAARRHKATPGRASVAGPTKATGKAKEAYDEGPGAPSSKIMGRPSRAELAHDQAMADVGREPAPKALCQESSGVSTPYVAGLSCLRPAKWLVKHDGSDPMAMCEGCADHNVRNRGGVYLPKGAPYVLYSPPEVEIALGAEKDTLSTGEEASLKPPAQPTNLPLGDELVVYVDKGMEKFHAYLEQELAKILGADRPASELAHVYINFRAMHDRVTITMKMMDAIKETLSEVTIPDTFKREKIKSFTTTSGWRVGTSLRLFASVIKAMRAGAFGWLRSNGLPDLIQETVHAGTLSATAKDLLEHGRELPEEFFETHYKPNTSLTKVQVKK
jgi:hypothetical protein